MGVSPPVAYSLLGVIMSTHQEESAQLDWNKVKQYCADVDELQKMFGSPFQKMFTPEEWVIYILHHPLLGDLPASSVADILGTSINSVRLRISRCERKYPDRWRHNRPKLVNEYGSQSWKRDNFRHNRPRHPLVDVVWNEDHSTAVAIIHDFDGVDREIRAKEVF
jgi:hypothetical protein